MQHTASLLSCFIKSKESVSFWFRLRSHHPYCYIGCVEKLYWSSFKLNLLIIMWYAVVWLGQKEQNYELLSTLKSLHIYSDTFINGGNENFQCKESHIQSKPVQRLNVIISHICTHLIQWKGKAELRKIATEAKKCGRKETEYWGNHFRPDYLDK